MFLPSKLNRGSYLPGPHELYTAFCAGGSAGRERDDRADVEVVVRPAVEPRADAGSEGVVDRRMTERAGDADAA